MAQSIFTFSRLSPVGSIRPPTMGPLSLRAHFPTNFISSQGFWDEMKMHILESSSSATPSLSGPNRPDSINIATLQRIKSRGDTRQHCTIIRSREGVAKKNVARPTCTDAISFQLQGEGADATPIAPRKWEWASGCPQTPPESTAPRDRRPRPIPRPHPKMAALGFSKSQSGI